MKVNLVKIHAYNKKGIFMSEKYVIVLGDNTSQKFQRK